MIEGTRLLRWSGVFNGIGAEREKRGFPKTGLRNLARYDSVKSELRVNLSLKLALATN